MNITGPWHCDNWWCNDASVGNLNSQRMVNSLHLVWWLNLQPLPAINQNIMFKWILIWIRSSRYALFGILLRTRWFHFRIPSASPSLSLSPFHVIIFIIIIISMLNKVFKQILEQKLLRKRCKCSDCNKQRVQQMQFSFEECRSSHQQCHAIVSLLTVPEWIHSTQ